MNTQRQDGALIDLGPVSTKTRGMPWGRDDFQGSLIIPTGLSAG